MTASSFDENFRRAAIERDRLRAREHGAAAVGAADHATKVRILQPVFAEFGHDAAQKLRSEKVEAHRVSYKANKAGPTYLWHLQTPGATVMFVKDQRSSGKGSSRGNSISAPFGARHSCC